MSKKEGKIWECKVCRYTELKIYHYEEFIKKCKNCMKPYRDSLDSKNIKINRGKDGSL